MSEEGESLKAWIQANMKSEATSELDRWKEDVASLLAIMPDGEVESKVTIDDTKARVLLQFIGRAYAEAGGIVETATLTNSQVKSATGIPAGTIDRVLAELRSEHLLLPSGRGEQQILPSRIGDAVRRIRGAAGKEDRDAGH